MIPLTAKSPKQSTMPIMSSTYEGGFGLRLLMVLGAIGGVSVGGLAGLRVDLAVDRNGLDVLVDRKASGIGSALDRGVFFGG